MDDKGSCKNLPEVGTPWKTFLNDMKLNTLEEYVYGILYFVQCDHSVSIFFFALATSMLRA